jgi:succinate dehydrogenase/fumarate reductase-like Fe-S protein
MLINGSVEYACIAKLTAGTIQVDPIPNQRVLRDLLVDTREREQKGADLRRQMRSMAKGGT